MISQFSNSLGRELRMWAVSPIGNVGSLVTFEVQLVAEILVAITMPK